MIVSQCMSEFIKLSTVNILVYSMSITPQTNGIQLAHKKQDRATDQKNTCNAYNYKGLESKCIKNTYQSV